MPNKLTPDVRTRTIVPRHDTQTRVLRSGENVVTPGNSQPLSQWQAKLGGLPCTVYGSVNPVNGTTGLYLSVRARIRIRHGGYSREETFAWPANGFVRRYVAEEVTVYADGLSTFAGGATSFRLGASVQDGFLPEDFQTSMVFGTVAGSSLAFAQAPDGAREWRASRIPFTGIVPDPSDGLVYSTLDSSGAVVSSGVGVSLDDVADWQLWPGAYSGIFATTNVSTLFPAQIEWRR
jgi:hypothetical protein